MYYDDTPEVCVVSKIRKLSRKTFFLLLCTHKIEGAPVLQSNACDLVPRSP